MENLQLGVLHGQEPNCFLASWPKANRYLYINKVADFVERGKRRKSTLS